LHRLALLQAFETARLDRRAVDKNIFAILAADKAVAFGVVELLYCSLFCHVDTDIPFNRFTPVPASRSRKRCEQTYQPLWVAVG